MNHFRAVENAVGSRGDYPAMRAEGLERCWDEVLMRCRRLAGGLAEMGLVSGDRLAFLCDNSDSFIEILLACSLAGIVTVPLNTRWSSAEIAHAISDCAPAALLVDARFAAAEFLEQSGVPVIIAGDTATVGSAHRLEQLFLADPLRPAMQRDQELLGIFYTGGTTGTPKGVAIRQSGLTYNARAVRETGAFPEGCVTLHVAPMFHLASAMAVAATSLAAGCHVWLRSFEPASYLAVVAKEQVTDALLVPTMITMLLDEPTFDPASLKSVRRLVYGASPMSPTALARVQHRLPWIALYQAYGMTELSCAATILGPAGHIGENSPASRGAAGYAIAGSRIEIAGPDGSRLAPGKIGEVLVRGPGVMSGYWGQEEATREALRGGWMHTGDGGWLDEHGCLFLADRLKDMIITGGENVFPAEVEAALHLIPQIQQCAVIGVPDERWGERVHAFVQLRPGTRVTEADISAHCRIALASYKCPKSFTVTETRLPMSAAGKILKAELRAEALLAGQ